MRQRREMRAKLQKMCRHGREDDLKDDVLRRVCGEYD
jgi:hypothetical protein